MSTSTAPVPVAARRAPPLPDDPLLPAAAGLLAGGAEAAAARFLAARGWSARDVDAVQALYRPGRSLAVRLRVTALPADGSGREAGVWLAVEARPPGTPPPAPPTRTVLAASPLPDPLADDGTLLTWVFPYDPALAGLGVAASPRAVRRRLWPRAGRVQVEPLRYRPRQRAVLRYRLDGAATVFAKVLPRARAEAVLAAARVLDPTAARPLDPAAGRSGAAEPDAVALGLAQGLLAPGVLVLRPVDGRPLRDLLLRGEAVPPPERLARLGDVLCALAPPGGVPPRDAAPEGRGRVRLAAAERAAAVAARLVPDLAAPLARVVEAAAAGVGGDAVPDRTVHGDLYEGQVLVAPGGRLGLVDLDDVGPGDPVLDAATFSAHLLTLALGAGAAAPRILAYRAELRGAFLARLGVGPASLAWREAFALLLLTTGPFRVLHPDWPAQVAARARLAADLLDAARG